MVSSQVSRKMVSSQVSRMSRNKKPHFIFPGLKIGKSAGGMMQGLAAKFKGKKKEEKETEEEEKEHGLTSEDGDEEEDEDEDEDEEEEEDDEEDDDDAVAGPAVEGSYDAAEWEHLEVNIIHSIYSTFRYTYQKS